jgi:signal transduction histidine kinase
VTDESKSIPIETRADLGRDPESILLQILDDARHIWSEGTFVHNYPSREDLSGVIKSAFTQLLNHLATFTPEIDMVAVEVNRALVSTLEGEPESPVVHVLVGPLAPLFDKRPSSYPKGEAYPFLEWREYVHLRVRIVRDREQLLALDRSEMVPRNTFVATLAAIQNAIERNPGDLEAQVDALLAQYPPELAALFASDAARRSAARVVLQSTFNTQSLLDSAGWESECFPPGLRKEYRPPFRDERNILFVPVRVAGETIGGAAVYSNHPLTGVAVPILDLVLHTLLFRIRTGDEAAAAQLAVNDRAKWEATLLYVHRLAHDVRKPLRQVQTILEGLLSDSSKEKPIDVREPLARVLRNIQDLQQVLSTRTGTSVEELREQAKRDARSDALLHLLEDACWIWKLEAAKRGKILEFHVLPHPDVRTFVPRFLVVEVLENLVSNAIRHAKHQVVVTAERFQQGASMQVRFAVVDDGPGIDESIRERIFVPYYVTGPTQRGLGLFLSRFIITQLLDGEELVLSSSSSGTTAAFTIPEVHN